MGKSITKKLLWWYDLEGRHDLPWNTTKDPYFIWVSEVILQQTRVQQGLPYYHRFITAFPTLKRLADSPLEEVLKLWEGLGYYSRARNLHKGAQYVQAHYNGSIPKDRNALLSVPGIGPYTASAIASFAFALPHAVVDGNVNRVVSRYLGITESIQTSTVSKQIANSTQNWLDPNRPEDYNRAMMDLGSTICTPRNPTCESCPISNACIAYKEGLITIIPYKHKKTKKVAREIFMILKTNEHGNIVVEKRKSKDIWQELYTLPWISERPETKKVYSTKHQLTHQTLYIEVYSDTNIESLRTKAKNTTEEYALPKPVRQFLLLLSKGELLSET